MVRGRRPRAIPPTLVKQSSKMNKTITSKRNCKLLHKTTNDGSYDGINKNFNKSIETITQRTRNLRKSLHKIQKQFDNQSITKFFQRKLKSNAINIDNDENACDAFATASDSDGSSSTTSSNNIHNGTADDSVKVQAFSSFNFNHDNHDILNEVDQNSNGSVHSTSSHNSIQPTNIFLQKPVLHLNIDKSSLNQVASIVINKHLEKCPNFASTTPTFTTFNGHIINANANTDQSQSAFSTAKQDTNQIDETNEQLPKQGTINTVSSSQQTPRITSPRKRCDKPKLRKQMPRKCANKIYTDHGIFDAIINSDSNSCDSGVVSDRSFESNSDGNKPTTPHRIVCPSSNTPTKGVTPKKPIQINVSNKLMTNRPRGRPTRNGTKLNSAKSFFTKLSAVAKSQEVSNHEYDEEEDDKDRIIKFEEPKMDDEAEMSSIVDELKSANSTNENHTIKAIIAKSEPQSQSRASTPSQTKPMQSKQMTDFFPVRRSIRKTKRAVEQEYLRHIEKAIEQQSEDGLVVKLFKDKGRGICAGRPFARGEFVVEYIGELIDQDEAARREEIYAKDSAFGCYMYYFKHKEQQWCIDATTETGKLGRLVNHSRNGNLVTKTVTYKNRPHLVLLAKENIPEGEELTYDYGDRTRESLMNHPWLAL